ncbi:MAG: quinolinate synthase NadA, partial [Nitrospira sp.]|nr:quinolinate synthase NadA [Nitrospira sp.]
GSTEFIIRTVTQADPGTTWAVGTELNLVNRLKHDQAEKQIYFLSPMVCRCSTMFRIDGPHLCWAVENLVQGNVVNHIQVPDEEKVFAKLALDRMMDLS